MREFLAMVWEYLYTHSEQVFTILFGAAALVVSTLTRLASIKQTKTAATLNTTIGEAKHVVNAVENAEKAAHDSAARVKELQDKVDELADTATTLQTMISATVEALQTVYNYSIHDEATRTTTNNLLTQAKFASDTKRADIIRELERIKEENERLTAAAAQSVEKVKKSLAVEDKKSKVVMRG
jgi:hypothetical protein